MSVEPLAVFVISYINSEFRRRAALETISASKLPLHGVALAHL